MNQRTLVLLFYWFAGASLFAQTDNSELSVSRLDLLDQRGYFTPDFKSAVHKLVNTRQQLRRAQTSETRFRADIPHLRERSAAAVVEAARLNKELAFFTHPEDTDFNALQSAMNNPSAAPQDCLVLAQAFIWSYPTDPRQAEAQSYLRKLKSGMEEKSKAAVSAATAQSAAHDAIVRRARAGELTLNEWQNFLRDMSQEELITFLGPPQVRNATYWIYTGAWISDPGNEGRDGLQINFNGTRVLSVVPKRS